MLYYRPYLLRLQFILRQGSCDQIGKIKAHSFMVYGHTTDAVLQAIPATDRVLLASRSCRSIGKIKVHRFMVYGSTPDATLRPYLLRL